MKPKVWRTTSFLPPAITCSDAAGTPMSLESSSLSSCTDASSDSMRTTPLHAPTTRRTTRPSLLRVSDSITTANAPSGLTGSAAGPWWRFDQSILSWARLLFGDHRGIY